MSDPIIVAKLASGDYYQGEILNAFNFADGDQYEKFNFARCRDNYFYGAIPGKVPAIRGGPWIVFFVARDPRLQRLTTIGWYKDAYFTDKTIRPEYAYISNFDSSKKYNTEFKYTIKAPFCRLLRTEERAAHPLPNVGNRLGNAKFVYVRGPRAGLDAWRQTWARYIDYMVQ